MSKSLRNYPDPNLVINSYGADAVRCVLRCGASLATFEYDVYPPLNQNVPRQFTHCPRR